eukprot:g8710.t1
MPIPVLPAAMAVKAMASITSAAAAANQTSSYANLAAQNVDLAIDQFNNAMANWESYIYGTPVSSIPAAARRSAVGQAPLAIIPDQMGMGGMIFPCFRTEEWMGRVFDKELALPADCLRASDVDLTPNYVRQYVGLFPQKVQQVRDQIRRTLFRQVLFKIQNVEVTHMKSCRADRVLAEVVSVSPATAWSLAEARSREQQEPRTRRTSSKAEDDTSCEMKSTAEGRSGEKENGPARRASSWEWVSNSIARNKQLAEGMFFDAVHSRLGRTKVELLQEELWRVDRCERVREYRVRYYREAEGDGFTTFVWPRGFGDKVAFAWYHMWS